MKSIAVSQAAVSRARCLEGQLIESKKAIAELTSELDSLRDAFRRDISNHEEEIIAISNQKAAELQAAASRARQFEERFIESKKRISELIFELGSLRNAFRRDILNHEEEILAILYDKADELEFVESRANYFEDRFIESKKANNMLRFELESVQNDFRREMWYINSPRFGQNKKR